jgi:hypothetical protein
VDEGDGMSTKQILLIIAVTSALALALAMIIERTQVRNFMAEFEDWWEVKNGQRQPSSDDAAAD